jgi:hypothetical protein
VGCGRRVHWFHSCVHIPCVVVVRDLPSTCCLATQVLGSSCLRSLSPSMSFTSGRSDISINQPPQLH